MAKRLEMAVWADRALTDTDKLKNGTADYAPMQAMTLVHCVGNQQVEVHTKQFTSANKLSPKEIADMFKSMAEGYAQDMVGTQQFMIIAHYQDCDAKGRYPFAIQQSISTDAMFEPGESGERRSNHLMTQAFLSQVFARQAVMDQHAMRHIEQLSLMAEKSQNAANRANEMLQELILKVTLDDRAHELQVIKAQEAVKTREGLFRLAPPVLNTLTGREIFPQSTEDTALIELLFENIDPASVMQMAGNLPDAVVGSIMGRWARHQKKKEAEARLTQQSKPLGPPQPEFGDDDELPSH